MTTPKSGSVRRGQECPRYTYDLLLSIEKLIYGGDGLARTPVAADGRSMAVFVPFVLPGEKVEAEIRQKKPGFARGSVAQLIEASSERVEARCPYFRQCGGCHYQHIPYERQLEFKAGILRETLRRIAKIELTAEIRLHGSPAWNYRIARRRWKRLSCSRMRPTSICWPGLFADARLTRKIYCAGRRLSSASCRESAE